MNSSIQYFGLAVNREAVRKLASAVLLALFLAVSAKAYSETFDTIISGGTVVDGSGSKPYAADVGVTAGRIVAIGDLTDAQAEQRIDATGKHVVPGFIDLHGHADDQQGHWRGMRSPDPIRRAAPAHVSQGITTSVANSDGLAPFMPLAEQIAIVEGHNGTGMNLAYMVPHSRIRFAVLGQDSAREATPEEIQQMRSLIQIDMKSGGWGLATVLENSDGSWTTTEEFIAMTAALKEFDGVVIAHPRSQSMKPGWWYPSKHEDMSGESYPLVFDMFQASEELIEVAEANDLRVSISHLSMRGPDPNQDALRTVEAVEEARARGVKIFADMHVTRANPLGIFSPLLPKWAIHAVPRGASFFIRPNAPHKAKNFKEQLRETLQDESNMAALQKDIPHSVAFWGGADEIFITDFPDASYIGRSLQELADMRGLSIVDMVIALGLEGYPDYPGGMLAYGNFRSMENMEQFAKTDWVAGDTDGYLTLPFDPGYIHPRFYGAYPNWLRTMVLERKAVPLEHAIRSLTGLGADIVGIKDRGYIREGYAADLSVIDLASIRQRATYYNVHAYSDGFDYVLVNGVPVVADGDVTMALPGKVLRKPL